MSRGDRSSLAKPGTSREHRADREGAARKKDTRECSRRGGQEGPVSEIPRSSRCLPAEFTFLDLDTRVMNHHSESQTQSSCASLHEFLLLVNNSYLRQMCGFVCCVHRGPRKILAAPVKEKQSALCSSPFQTPPSYILLLLSPR